MHIQNAEGGTKSEAHANGMTKFIVHRLRGNWHAPALWSRLSHAGFVLYHLFRAQTSSATTLQNKITSCLAPCPCRTGEDDSPKPSCNNSGAFCCTFVNKVLNLMV